MARRLESSGLLKLLPTGIPLPLSAAHTMVTILVALGVAYLYMPGLFDVYYLAPSQERLHHLSILGFFLPQQAFQSPLVGGLCKGLFVVMGYSWIRNIWVPYSAWVATLAFFVVTSIGIENSFYTKHEIHPIMAGLIVMSAWYSWHGRRMKVTPRALRGQLRAPGWWRELCIAWFAITYTWSGVTKLWVSGAGWLHGDLLRIWLMRSQEGIYCGAPCRRISQFVIDSPVIALLGQSGILLLECTALLMVFVVPTRIWFGVAFATFHLLCNMLFGFHFWAATVLGAYLLMLAELDLVRLVKYRASAAVHPATSRDERD